MNSTMNCSRISQPFFIDKEEVDKNTKLWQKLVKLMNN